jgi:hypothetical protein
MWEEWAKRANVIPYPNEAKKGKKKGEKEMEDKTKDD